MAELSRRTAEERSIGELFGELSQDVGLLVRQEAQLAKTEMQTEALEGHRGPGVARHRRHRGAGRRSGADRRR